MSEVKHTPGPWRVREKIWNRDKFGNGVKVLSIVAGAEEWKANKGHSHPDDATYVVDEFQILDTYTVDYNFDVPMIYREADAHLIAAAPDLLEALKAVKARRIAWPAEIEKAVFAAIAKAEGR